MIIEQEDIGKRRNCSQVDEIGGWIVEMREGGMIRGFRGGIMVMTMVMVMTVVMVMTTLLVMLIVTILVRMRVGEMMRVS